MFNAVVRRKTAEQKLSRITGVLVEQAKALGVNDIKFRNAVLECLIALERKRSQRISKGTKAGHAAAGNKGGRPRIVANADAVLAHSCAGMTLGEMAKSLGISKSTACRMRQRAGITG